MQLDTPVATPNPTPPSTPRPSAHAEDVDETIDLTSDTPPASPRERSVKVEPGMTFATSGPYATFEDLNAAMQKYAKDTGMQLVIRSCSKRDATDPTTGEPVKLYQTIMWKSAAQHH